MRKTSGALIDRDELLPSPGWEKQGVGKEGQCFWMDEDSICRLGRNDTCLTSGLVTSASCAGTYLAGGWRRRVEYTSRHVT